MALLGRRGVFAGSGGGAEMDYSRRYFPDSYQVECSDAKLRSVEAWRVPFG